MEKALYLSGKKYISASRAAALVGYTGDYVGQLARAGKIDATLVGRSWYVFEDSILHHKSTSTGSHKKNSSKKIFLSDIDTLSEEVIDKKIEIEKKVEVPVAPVSYSEEKNPVLFPSLSRKINFEVVKTKTSDSIQKNKTRKILSPFEKAALLVTAFLLFISISFGAVMEMDSIKNKTLSLLDKTLDSTRNSKQTAFALGAFTKDLFSALIGPWQEDPSLENPPVSVPTKEKETIIVIKESVPSPAPVTSSNSQAFSVFSPSQAKSYIDARIDLKLAGLQATVALPSSFYVTRADLTRQLDAIVGRTSASGSSSNSSSVDLTSLSSLSPLIYNSSNGIFSFDFGTHNVWTGNNEFISASTTLLTTSSLSLLGQTGCLSADGLGNVTGNGLGCGSGGGSGGGTWSTTTSEVVGQLINFPNATSDLIAIGSNSTTTAEFYFDPNTRTFILNSASSTIIGNSTTTGMLGAGSIFINGDRITDLTGSGLSLSSGTLTVSGLTTSNLASANISQFTNDAGFVTTDLSNTWSALQTFGNSSTTAASFFTASSTFGNFGTLNIATTTAGCASINSSGQVFSIGSPCGSGGGNTFAFPFTVNSWGNSTTTTLGFLNGFISTASSTQSGPFRLSALSQGLAYIGSGGLVGSTATSTLTPSSPLTGSFIQVGSGGSLGCQTASGSQTGCLLSTDWNTFNGKQAAGNYITALTGDVAASGPGSVAATLATVNSNVGSFTNANITVNGKGLITAASNGAVSSGYPFPLTGNATSTLTQFNGGLTAYGTSTIGSGSQAGGLTISGGATTTGNAYIAGSLGIGTSTVNGLLTLGFPNSALTSFAQGNLSIMDPNNGGYASVQIGGTYGANINLDKGINNRQGIDASNITGSVGMFANNTLKFYTNGNGNNLVAQFGTDTGAPNANTYFTGNMGIGTSTPYAKLSVVGQIVGAYFTGTTTATSTLGGGMNISSGCYAINGTCIGGGTLGSSYSFPLTGNATSTLTQFNGGLTAFASSTIGNGTSGGGLTVSGNATTTTLTGAGLANCSASTGKLVWNDGSFSCASDAGAGGGLTSLNGQTGSNQTFATTSDTNILLTVTSVGDVHTFSPSWTGTLAANRGGTGISNPLAAGILLGSYAGGSFQQLATSSLGLSSTDIREGNKLFYTDDRVNIYVHASTTVPKTYTANVFTALQSFAYSSSTNYSSFVTASTTNLIVNGESFQDLTGSGLSLSSGTLTVSGLTTSNLASANISQFTNDAGYLTSALTSYDAFTHPALGISATTSLMQLYGNASSTLLSANQAWFGSTGTTTITTEGYVAIGTTSPMGVLHAISTSSSFPVVFQRDGGATLLQLYNANTTDGQSSNLDYAAQTTGVGASPKVIMASVKGIYTTHNHPTRASELAFYTTSAGTLGERLRIDPTGNVGVGTTTPLSKLTVSGGATIGADYNIAAPTNGLLVEGNVGIGTTNPIYKLDVNGAVRINSGNALRFFKSDGTTEALNISSGASSSFLTAPVGSIQITTSAGAMAFNSSSGHLFRNETGLTTYMSITSAGNVGIGTTTSNYILNPFSATAPQLALSAGAGLSQWTFRNAGGKLYFSTTTVAGTATSSVAALTIDTNGKVIANCFSTDGSSCITTGSGASTTLLTDLNTFSGVNNFANKLGVGTTTPFANLSIQGVSGQANSLFLISSSTGQDLLSFGMGVNEDSDPVLALTYGNNSYLDGLNNIDTAPFVIQGSPVMNGGDRAGSASHTFYSGQFLASSYITGGGQFFEGGDLEIASPGAFYATGGPLNFEAGQVSVNDITVNGAQFDLNSGVYDNGEYQSGDIYMKSGNNTNSVSGNSGAVTIETGTASGEAGGIYLNAGGGSELGGSIGLNTGNNLSSGNGGDVLVGLGSGAAGGRSGRFGIGTTSPSSLLSIGDTGGINFGLATSTFSTTGGINITSGCYAVGGVCIGGSTGLSSYDAFTHPALGISATTSLMQLYGNASSTLLSANQAWFGSTGTTTITTAGFIGVGTSSPTALISTQAFGSLNDLFRVSSTTGAALFSINRYGALVQNLSSSTALDIQNGSGSSVFAVDTTQSTGSGIDITAVSGQTSNLLNLYSSAGTFLSGFTASGGLFMNTSSSTAVNIYDGSGNAALVLSSSARSLAIGTSTLAYNFTVQGDQASNYIARIDNKNTANTADGLLISLGVVNASRAATNYFIGFADGSQTIAGKIQGGTSAVAYTTSAADIAEYFRIGNIEEKPFPGEIVMLDKDVEKGVKVAVAEEGEEAEPFGIISSNPGFIGNGPICLARDADCDSNYEKYNVLVALAGQVPLRVTNENGPVEIGDYLTLSKTIPGAAMKLKESGYIVGQALTRATSTLIASTTSVTAYVKNGWREIAPIVASVSTTTASSTDSFIPAVWTPLFDFLKNVGFEIGQNFVKITHLVTDFITTKKIETEELCIKDICVDRDELEALLLNAGLQDTPQISDIPDGPAAPPGDMGTSTPATSTPLIIPPSTDSASSTPELVSPELIVPEPPTPEILEVVSDPVSTSPEVPTVNEEITP